MVVPKSTKKSTATPAAEESKVTSKKVTKTITPAPQQQQQQTTPDVSTTKKVLSKFEKNRTFPTATPSTLKTSKSNKKPIEVEKTPIEKIKEIESQVIDSTENSNRILEIIKICKSNIKELEIVFESIKSLERIFTHLFDSSNPIICREFTLLKNSSKEVQSKSKEPLVIYIHWLYKIYNGYLELLKEELLIHEDPSIQLPTLTTLLNILKRESILLSSLPNEATDGIIINDEDKQHYYNISKQSLKQLISTMMFSNTFNTKLLDHFTENYLSKYQDLFYYSLWSINEISASTMQLLTKKNDNGKDFQLHYPNVSISKFVENLFDFLTFFEPLQLVPDEWEFWVGKPHFACITENNSSLKTKLKQQSKKSQLEKPKNFNEKEWEKISSNWSLLTKVSSYKLIFSKAWISFLTLPLPPTIYKHVLLGLPDRVFPYLTDARVLLDFFTNSYDLGGVTSILALNGVFILITKYNLEYPDFFKKLYSLFQPGVLYAKYRARFFKLADLFLSSKSLPNYMVAAFIKRCATLCLISPPYGSLILLPLIYNLLQRNVTCHCLINNPIKQLTNAQIQAQQQQQQQVTRQSVLLIKQDIEQPESSLDIKGLYGNDPYDPLEEDPSKCNAISSSLWEIQILRDHYAPEVSKMAKLFDGGLKNIIDLNEFSFVTYQVMYENSFKKKSSTVPLAYQQKSQLIEQDTDFMSDWKF
ncbi:hypothetical protein RB653_002326 [Dictyostelium firmibasis]|uniref:CCAAT-binding factor domain-containing protein n=1 Tax=Dictyostelium firmibasis TaxID=79012 RepID=A0AAN7YYM3_9MYCE